MNGDFFWKYMVGNSRGLFEDTILTLVWRNQGKLRNISVLIVSAEIRTEDLLNTSKRRYRLSQTSPYGILISVRASYLRRAYEYYLRNSILFPLEHVISASVISVTALLRYSMLST
jgi:hypothetical protein